MPSKKPSKSFRPDPGLWAWFIDLLDTVEVDGDDRRAGYKRGDERRPADSPTATSVLEALIEGWCHLAESRKPLALGRLRRRCKEPRWRDEAGP